MTRLKLKPNLFFYVLGKRDDCYIINDELLLLHLNHTFFVIKDLLLRTRNPKGKILLIGLNPNHLTIFKKASELTLQNYIVGKWVGGLVTKKDSYSSNSLNCYAKANSNLAKNTPPESFQFWSSKFSLIIIFDPYEDSYCIKEVKRLRVPLICFCYQDQNKFSRKGNPILGNILSFEFIYRFFQRFVKIVRPIVKENLNKHN